MTKVSAAAYLDQIQEVLDGYAQMMQKWRHLIAEAEKVGIEAKLNRLKTALWNLNNAWKMFQDLDDDMAVVESKTKKKGAALHAAKPVRKNKEK